MGKLAYIVFNLISSSLRIGYRLSPSANICISKLFRLIEEQYDSGLFYHI